MQASKHFHKFQERYASAHDRSRPNSSPVSKGQARSLSPPVHSTKRARHARQPSAAPSSVQKSVAKNSSSSNSDRSLKFNRQAKDNLQRQARFETPAALADPLGAFAFQAAHKQRALQSGLRLLKGKSSQARIVSSNLRSPRERPAAQLDSQKLQPTNDFAKFAHGKKQRQLHAEPEAHPTNTSQPRQQVHANVRQRQQQSNHSQAGNKGAALAQSQKAPASESMHRDSPGVAQTAPQAQQIDSSNYFHSAKTALHTLIQAHHAIPSLHTMSEPDRAALTSLLSSKLDGIDITAQVQQQFLPKPQEQAPEQKALEQTAPEQQPSAASSVDCTPSPESVAQHQSSARRFKSHKSVLPHQRFPHSALPCICLSSASHASAASSGSGQGQVTHHHLQQPPEESFLNMLQSHESIRHDVSRSRWQYAEQQQDDAYVPDMLMEAEQDNLSHAESPKLDWSSGTRAATELMSSWSHHSQAWNARDSLAQLAHDEEADLFAQSLNCQQQSMTDDVDGLSAEDALFARAEQSPAWPDTGQSHEACLAIKHRASPSSQTSHDLLAEPLSTSHGQDAELNALFEHKEPYSAAALDQFNARHSMLSSSTDRVMLQHSAQHQAMLTDKDDWLNAQVQHALSTQLQHSQHDTCNTDLQALFESRSRGLSEQANTLFAEASSDPWLDSLNVEQHLVVKGRDFGWLSDDR